MWNAESTINIQQWWVWYAVNMFNIENVTIIVNFGYVTRRHNQIISIFPILIGFRYLNPYSLNIKIRTIAHGQHRVRCPFGNAKITLSDSVIGLYSVCIRFEYVISLCVYRELPKKNLAVEFIMYHISSLSGVLLNNWRPYQSPSSILLRIVWNGGMMFLFK